MTDDRRNDAARRRKRFWFTVIVVLWTVAYFVVRLWSWCLYNGCAFGPHATHGHHASVSPPPAHPAGGTR